MGYLVLLVGTPYMDGFYARESDALGVKKTFERDYKGIQVEVVSTENGFVIGDDIFWARNIETLEAINARKLRARHSKRAI